MKNIHKLLFPFVLILLSALVIVTCQTSTGDDPDQPGPSGPVTNDPGQISGNLIFNDGNRITGTMPLNANLADLKMDKDTVNLWPGIKNRIRIQNNGTSVSGMLIHIPGADNYHKVEIETDESSDSISVFYIDIDPAGLDLPIDAKIVIAPTDANGDIIDEFGHDLHVDPPSDGTSGGADPGSPEFCAPAINKNLYWVYTMLDGVFQNAPGYHEPSNYNVGGCCYEGKSSSCQNINASVNVDNQWSQIKEEVFKFFDDGNFAYVLSRDFNDYDPKSTNFCSGKAGYSFRSSGLNTAGSYSMSSANGFDTFSEITIHEIDFDLDDALNLGYGPFTQPNDQASHLEYFLGCRHYIEINNIEGSTYLRVFETEPGSGLNWYD